MPNNATSLLFDLPVRVDCQVEGFRSAVDELLAGWRPATGQSAAIHVALQPFDADAVSARVAADARRIARTRAPVELYHDSSRLWMVDERIGLVEVDFPGQRVTAFLAASTTVPADRAVEFALLRPLAQLLRAHGLHLLPARAIARGRRGALLLNGEGDIERELDLLKNRGYRLLAGRWIILCEGPGRWRMSDVDRDVCCAAVLMVRPARKAKAHLSVLAGTAAEAALRSAWPVMELTPAPRPPTASTRLATTARCAHLQLSHDPADAVVLIESLDER